MNAQQNIGPLSNPVELNGTKTYYIRFAKTGECSEIGELTLTVKIPKTSSILEDKKICPDATIDLDPGEDFDSYSWSNGAITQTINVGVGNYWVDLTFNGCTYRQNVSVTEVELPVISAIEIVGTTVTFTVTGGNAPYQYSLNGINYQDSNVFANVPYGQNTVYIKSADNCAAAEQIFTIIRLLNVITPNGDGYNDALNYSDLLYKEEVSLKIFDRHGAVLFTGDKSNNFTWDGKINGRPISTATYWYIVQWRDPGAKALTQHSGWVLVKNKANE